jgi:peptidoglycan hydrolase-like protein with peptidoglycan-binding domain
MLTNKGLVEHAKKALAERWGYVWGGYGQLLTEAILAQKIRQYPDNVGVYKDFIRANWMGSRVADCVGLIKSYYWTQEGRVKYDASTDLSADGMLNAAKERGAISGLPEIPGILVHRTGHVGIYIGGGKVIESKGTKYGVVQTELRYGAWKYWSKCPFIQYIQDLPKPTETKPILTYPGYLLKFNLRKVDKNVKTLQEKLGIPADGIFGQQTFSAVKSYQRRNELEVDGIVGPVTWESLFG